jgi:alkanesulfonate monooxygenase SsuD/methylene tetrahydromethanopterin reductase-like flavin-dependent oxidoreductase (luciferase family)
MTAEQPMVQVPELRYPRILAANGPKMLPLAGEIADGAIPILVPPEFTANARQILGPDKILVLGLTAAVDEDRDRARAAARRFVSEGWFPEASVAKRSPVGPYRSCGKGKLT